MKYNDFKSLNYILIGITIGILVISCKTPPFYQNSVTFPHQSWHKDSLVTFKVSINDTNRVYSLFFSVVNTKDYFYQNIFLFSNIILPSGSIVRDTVELILSDLDGKWLGKPVRGGYKSTYMIRKIKFKELGLYTYSIEQAMRCRNKECNLENIKSFDVLIY